MNTKVRNAVVAAVVLVLVSVALARNELVVYLDYGAPWVSSQAQQEVLLVSTTPGLVGTGEVASDQAPQASPPPLVPCEDASEGMPCVVIATQPNDIVGVWKQYLGNPNLNAPGGMGYIRYTRDGTITLADTPENTAAPYPPYPRGSYAFENGTLIMTAEGDMVPPECRTARYELRVYRLGQQPVALFYTPIEDECMGRRMDLRYPLIWVAAVN